MRRSGARGVLGSGVAVAMLLMGAPAAAQPASAARAEELLASPIALVVVLGAVALLPFAFMTLTAFVKISTVLQIVRGAIGAQNVPSNLVVMALAGALTVLAMAPVGGRIAERAEPLFAPGAQRGTSAWVLGLVEAARRARPGTGEWTGAGTRR